MKSRIGRTTNMATGSGLMSARRFGSRSAKMTKSDVDRMKERMNPRFGNCSGFRTKERHQSKKGEKAASPTMPPKSATALTAT